MFGMVPNGVVSGGAGPWVRIPILTELSVRIGILTHGPAPPVIEPCQMFHIVLIERWELYPIHGYCQYTDTADREGICYHANMRLIRRLTELQEQHGHLSEDTLRELARARTCRCTGCKSWCRSIRTFTPHRRHPEMSPFAVT